MQYKNFILAFVCLIAFAISSANAKICRTSHGIAWCENDRCYWKDGSGTFKINGCNQIIFKDGVERFRGSNCRKCASTKCGIVQSRYSGRLNYYHSANGYKLTANGWCYSG